MESLGRRVSWVTLGRLANALNLLLVNAILARHLSEVGFGQYQKVWMVLNIGIPLFLFGLPLGISYFLPGLQAQKRNSFLLQQVFLIWITAALFCIGLLLAAPQLAHLFGIADLAPLLRLAAFIGAGLIACGFWESFLIVYDRHRLLAFSLFAFALIYLVAVLVGCFVGQSLYWIFAGLCFFALCRVVVCIGVLIKLAGPPVLHLNREWLRRQLAYTLPIGLRDGIGILAKFTDKLIALFVASTGQFVYYYMGAWELPVVGLVVDSMLSVIMPDFAAAYRRREVARILELMRLAARRISLLVFPAAAFSFVAAPEFMVLLYGEAYRVSGDYFRVFSLILPCRISTGGLVLLAAGRPNIVLLGTALDILLAVSLGLALLPWYGLLGPAIALVFSTYCQVAFNLWQAGRVVDRRLWNLLPWGRLAKWVLFNAAIGGITSFSLIFSHPLYNILVGGLVFGTLYVAGGYFAGFYDDQEQAIIRHWMTKVRDLFCRAGKGEG